MSTPTSDPESESDGAFPPPLDPTAVGLGTVAFLLGAVVSGGLVGGPLGGFVAGYLSGRGLRSGVWHGVVTWGVATGVVLVAVALVGVLGYGDGSGTFQTLVRLALAASLPLGAVAGAVGGVLGQYRKPGALDGFVGRDRE